jgi:glutamyl-tRNA synthetase
MPTTPPRVRFAPSPTGFLHIGGARTALFNWLFARRAREGGKGTFILRIEDTDQVRSTAPSVEAIFEGMKWLGLDWDEGPGVEGPHAPYFQTQRLATYERHADKLIEKGAAYRCTCTKEELDALRKQLDKGVGFRYPGICRNKNITKGTPGAVVRFRMPETGETAFDDLVKGRIATPNEQLQDEVILRADGVPLYNFGAVVDDVEMEITLVARGDDHVVNTPRQILMYRALDYPVPAFAHLPMILGADKQRLSKRHGAVSVLQYREDGYLPGALINYLARLGWSHGDQEIFTVAELVEKFDWEQVGATAGVFNPEKLLWLNEQWIKTMPPAALAPLLLPFLEKDGVRAPVEKLAEVLPLVQGRAKTLLELAAKARFFFTELKLDAADAKKHLTPEARPLLVEARKLIEEKIGQGAEAMEASFRELATAKGLGLGKIAQPLRVAVTGSSVSPPLFQTIAFFGLSETLRRLDEAEKQSGAGLPSAGSTP